MSSTIFTWYILEYFAPFDLTCADEFWKNETDAAWLGKQEENTNLYLLNIHYNDNRNSTGVLFKSCQC